MPILAYRLFQYGNGIGGTEPHTRPTECMLIRAAGVERGRARRTYVCNRVYTWYAITILLVA